MTGGAVEAMRKAQELLMAELNLFPDFRRECRPSGSLSAASIHSQLASCPFVRAALAAQGRLKIRPFRSFKLALDRLQLELVLLDMPVHSVLTPDEMAFTIGSIGAFRMSSTTPLDPVAEAVFSAAVQTS